MVEAAANSEGEAKGCLRMPRISFVPTREHLRTGLTRYPEVKFRVDAVLIRPESLRHCAEESGGRKSSLVPADKADHS